MANREELLVIRAARSGQAAAQLALGERYLSGGRGLPKSGASALYWLDRAAQQKEREAWILIGSHIPFEVAKQATQRAKLCRWYALAFDAGVMQAGVVLAKLVLSQTDFPIEGALRDKAMSALEAAARAGIADAQWLMAQQLERTDAKARSDAPDVSAECAQHPAPSQENMLDWAAQAACGGVVGAQRALAEHAWTVADTGTFLRWSLPLARAVVCRWPGVDAGAAHLSGDDALMLTRCAQALELEAGSDSQEIERFWELAARAGDREAQFRLGLRLAKMDAGGARLPALAGSAQYKKSLRWLSMAAEQGMADAWYAMSQIYLKPEFSQRNLAGAQAHLERAAHAGHKVAQRDLGISAWRARREAPANDVRAVYWLQKAAVQGDQEALVLLGKIAPPATPSAWAIEAQAQLTRDVANAHPFLAARIELAALFGLTRAETLLIDLHAANCGHCLVVDIRERHPRSRRRLVPVHTGEERRALDRIARLFEDVDCGPSGPEGNYRQRLYRLKRVLGAECAGTGR